MRDCTDRQWAFQSGGLAGDSSGRVRNVQPSLRSVGHIQNQEGAAPTALPRQAGAGGIIIHRCPSPNPGLGSHGRLHGKPGQAGQARLAGRPSGPRERMGSLLRSSHAGTNEALALPALKRVIRVETLSQSAKALLPPHKCGGSHHQFGQVDFQTSLRDWSQYAGMAGLFCASAVRIGSPRALSKSTDRKS